MNRFIVSSLLVCVALFGCGPVPGDPTDAQQPIDTSESPGPIDSDCDAEIVETKLPGQRGSKVVALCTACDSGCDDKGDRCAKYGDACDFFGERGVCGACCDGERGELRCHPIE